MTDDQPKNTRPLPFGAIPTLLKDLLPHAGEDIDPVAMARKDLKSSLPRRFWTRVEVKQQPDGFGIALDDRLTKTPARKPLLVPSRALAEHMAQEWHAIAEVIDPAQMPLTRLVNSALDGVSLQMEEVQADAARYAGSDLLCYRAERPERLVLRQHAEWQPWLDWAEQTHGARLVTTAGIIHVPQDTRALAALAEAVAIHDTIGLAALGVLVPALGSLVLGLAVAAGALSGAEAHAVSVLDDIFQEELWGRDADAHAGRLRVAADVVVAENFLSLARA